MLIRCSKYCSMTARTARITSSVRSGGRIELSVIERPFSDVAEAARSAHIADAEQMALFGRMGGQAAVLGRPGDRSLPLFFGQLHLRLGGHEKRRSEEHTSELPSLMRISYAVFCLKQKTTVYTPLHT